MTTVSHRHLTAKVPQRVVVIGKSSFVGAAIMHHLEGLKVPCLGVGRDDVDLLEPDATTRLAALLRPSDSVVAVAAIAPCKTVAMLADNIILAKNILEALDHVKVSHVINISSDAVYPDQPLPLTENVPPSPDTLHGAMHLAREIAFRTSMGAPLATLRPSLLFGANDPHNGYGPNRFRRLAQEEAPIVLFGEGEERRDHVFIDDLAEIATRMLFHGSTGTLNVATGKVFSFAEIAQKVVAIAESSSLIKTSARVGDMPHKGYRAFDIAACLSAFPDFTFTSLEAGLKKAQEMEKISYG